MMQMNMAMEEHMDLSVLQFLATLTEYVGRKEQFFDV